MTIRQVIDQLDSLQPNTFTDHDKICWLSALDAQIKTEILDLYEGADVPFAGYGDDTDGGTVLLAQAPYDQMYLQYLQSQIHYHNAEFDRYNNAIALFQASCDGFRSHCSRTRRTKAAAFRYF